MAVLTRNASTASCDSSKDTRSDSSGLQDATKPSLLMMAQAGKLPAMYYWHSSGVMLRQCHHSVARVQSAACRPQSAAETVTTPKRAPDDEDHRPIAQRASKCCASCFFACGSTHLLTRGGSDPRRCWCNRDGEPLKVSPSGRRAGAGDGPPPPLRWSSIVLRCVPIPPIVLAVGSGHAAGTEDTATSSVAG